MFELTKIISFCQKDFKDNSISLKSLMNVFEEIAVSHAEILGVGFDSLIKKNKLWVISKLKIDILLQLNLDKEYTLKTYIIDRGKFDCDRHFEIISEDKIFVRAVYNWCLIDTMTRKLSSFESIDYPVPIRQIKDSTLKLNKFDFDNLNNQADFIVDKNCLDNNSHMNNKVYGTLIEQFFNRNFKQIIINFDHEAKLNDEIKLYYSNEENQFKIIAKVKNDICFCSLVTF